MERGGELDIISTIIQISKFILYLKTKFKKINQRSILLEIKKKHSIIKT